MNDMNYKNQTNAKVGKTWTLDTTISAIEQVFLSEDLINNSTTETINFSD
tara:strand:+ start:58650 stop:58799 length:150 start_codon:yes stop_codon:yes gene_type:complete